MRRRRGRVGSWGKKSWTQTRTRDSRATTRTNRTTTTLPTLCPRRDPGPGRTRTHHRRRRPPDHSRPHPRLPIAHDLVHPHLHPPKTRPHVHRRGHGNTRGRRCRRFRRGCRCIRNRMMDGGICFRFCRAVGRWED